MGWLSSFVVVALIMVQGNWMAESGKSSNDFVKTNGKHFVMNKKPMYINGFNAYWLMYMASDPSTREKVTSAFQQASNNGLNVARTWAFRDGVSDRPLQTAPGTYNEDVFKGLDFVISEAKKNGIYMILSLVNCYSDYGGKPQYVQWAKERGVQVSNEDDFYTNSAVKEYYKNHVKAVVTRTNTVTGVAYKDDPTIFAWELINEPRSNDSSGATVQSWVKEMAEYVKSIDSNHLLEIGLEGFYAESKKQFNPNNLVLGTDFIANNQLPQIDFATIHLYEEQWLQNQSEEEQAAFADKFIQSHVQDSDSVLNKPLVIGEFGKSSKLPGYSLEKRDKYYGKIYDAIYRSVSGGGSFCGGLFWQLLAQGMDNMGDGYEVILENNPSTATIIAQQSKKLSSLA